MSASIERSAAWLLALTLLSGCTVGPSYHPPAAPSAATYKELVAAEGDAAGGWKLAQPNDAVIRDNWWELFDDPQLNALEQQVNVSNQNIAASFASWFAGSVRAIEAVWKVPSPLWLNPISLRTESRNR